MRDGFYCHVEMTGCAFLSVFMICFVFVINLFVQGIKGWGWQHHFVLLQAGKKM